MLFQACLYKYFTTSYWQSDERCIARVTAVMSESDFLNTLGKLENGSHLAMPIELECKPDWIYARAQLKVGRIIRLWLGEDFPGEPPPIVGDHFDERDLQGYLAYG